MHIARLTWFVWVDLVVGSRLVICLFADLVVTWIRELVLFCVCWLLFWGLRLWFTGCWFVCSLWIVGYCGVLLLCCL